MFLHASTLEFTLTGGAAGGAKRPYLLNAPLSPELIDVLDRLG
jgi:23S rRNA pseudouridine955/2504/2580 synthase